MKWILNYYPCCIHFNILSISRVRYDHKIKDKALCIFEACQQQPDKRCAVTRRPSEKNISSEHLEISMTYLSYAKQF